MILVLIIPTSRLMALAYLKSLSSLCFSLSQFSIRFYFKLSCLSLHVSWLDLNRFPVVKWYSSQLRFNDTVA